jgi:hypothetical protein
MNKEKKPDIDTMTGNNIAAYISELTLCKISDKDLDSLIQRAYRQTSGNFYSNAPTVLSVFIAEKHGRIAEKRGLTSKRLSMISLIISIIALLAVLSFSCLDYFGDKQWQIDQILILEDIKNTIPSPEGE